MLFSRPPAYHTHHTTPKIHHFINHYFISTRPSYAVLLRLRPFPLAATSRTSFAAADWSRCSQHTPLCYQSPASSQPASRAAASLPCRRSQEPPASLLAATVSIYLFIYYSLSQSPLSDTSYPPRHSQLLAPPHPGASRVIARNNG